jgi:hypothetical protein
MSISGSGYNKIVENLSDTTASLDIMSDLQISTTYNWYIKSTDGKDTTKSSILSFTTSASIVKVNDTKNIIPSTVTLYQNYPNPFNPSTRIEYSIPANAFVIIEIYDVYGREIEKLINKEQEAGRYSITWEPKNIPSGIYYYKIQSGKYSEVRKMILLR